TATSCSPPGWRASASGSSSFTRSGWWTACSAAVRTGRRSDLHLAAIAARCRGRRSKRDCRLDVGVVRLAPRVQLVDDVAAEDMAVVGVDRKQVGRLPGEGYID